MKTQREKTDVEAPSDHCPVFTSKEHCSWLLDPEASGQASRW